MTLAWTMEWVWMCFYKGVGFFGELGGKGPGANSKSLENRAVFFILYHTFLCYGLYLSVLWQCPWKHYWDMVEPLRGRALGEVLESLVLCPEGDCGTLLILCSLFCFLTLGSVSLLHPHIPTMLCCVITGPEWWGQLIMEWSLQNQPK